MSAEASSVDFPLSWKIETALHRPLVSTVFLLPVNDSLENTPAVLALLDVADHLHQNEVGRQFWVARADWS